MAQVRRMYGQKIPAGRIADKTAELTTDLSGMKENYIIDDYCCQKCWWYPGANWNHIDHITLDVEGELISPCIKCGTYNLLDLELIPPDEPDGLGKMRTSMENFIDLIFDTVRRIEHQEYRATHPIPTNWNALDREVCPNCNDKTHRRHYCINQNLKMNPNTGMERL